MIPFSHRLSADGAELLRPSREVRASRLEHDPEKWERFSEKIVLQQ
jgi:hypothetical protein